VPYGSGHDEDRVRARARLRRRLAFFKVWYWINYPLEIINLQRVKDEIDRLEKALP